MAYGGNNGQNKGPFLAIDLGLVFGDNKAYRMSIQKNSKVRLEIFNPTINADGSASWDFVRGKVGITLNWNDVHKLYLASKELVKIYNIVKSGKVDLEDPKNAVLKTKIMRIPLVAPSTGEAYGEIQVGLKPDPKIPNEETFSFAFSTRLKDGSTFHESFIFRRTNNLMGLFEYSDGNKKIHESYSVHLEFTDFIEQLESIVRFGRMAFGLYSSLLFTKSSGGGSSHGGSSGGGYSNSSQGNDGSSYDSGDGDIPF
jgi:uncharacterized membrane protein YgcG